MIKLQDYGLKKAERNTYIPTILSSNNDLIKKDRIVIIRTMPDEICIVYSPINLFCDPAYEISTSYLIKLSNELDKY